MVLKIKVALIRLVQIFLFFIPLKENRILFYVNNRKGFVCNPGALMDFIRRTEPGRYEMAWATRFPGSCEARDGVTVVRQRSLPYFAYFLRTKYVITNDMIDEALVKKRGQVFLTTWHGGGAYKKVGAGTTGEDASFARNFPRWYGRLDYFVSSCRACTDLYADAFSLKRECFLETGTPRNDIFFRDDEEIRRRVRRFYNLPESTRILLFAPSFQMSAPEKENYGREELIQTAEKLRAGTGCPWVVLYRCHYLRDGAHCDGSPLLRDGNAYHEMQDLLYTADVLATDFSSSIWDFSLTGRCIVLLENRLREYEAEDRGFFVPPDTWPYPRAAGINQLADVIIANRDTDFSSVYKKHQEEMGSFEAGNACEQIVNTVIKGEKKR